MIGLGLGIAKRRGSASFVHRTFDFSAVTPGAYAALTTDTGLILTRASVGSIQTAAATMVLDVAVDTARIRSNGTITGLLLEGARTNVVLYSRDMSNAAWTAGSGVTSTYNTAAGTDGAVLADRQQVNSSGYSRYQFISSLTAGTYVGNVWYKEGSAAGGYQYQLDDNVGNVIAVGGTATSTWTRLSLNATVAGTTLTYVPADGRNRAANGGVVAGARDVILDFHQIERGKYPTSSIVTAGATGTRAGERLRYDTPAAFISNGRLSMHLTMYPLGAWNEYEATYRLWTIDANNYAEVVHTNRTITVCIGGVVTSFIGAIQIWGRLDKVEIWMSVGGGTNSVIASQLNDGGGSSLALPGTAQGTVSPGANPIDILSNGTSSQFACILSKISTVQPAWV